MKNRVERLAENIEVMAALNSAAGNAEGTTGPVRAVLRLCLDVHRSGGTHVSILGLLEVMRREIGADDVT